MVGQAKLIGVGFQFLRFAWAAPCSLVGLAFGIVLLALGAHVRTVRGTIEFAFRPSALECGRIARALPYRAITLGHVILGVTADDLDASREHERVHVAQYERWGLLFFLAYPLASVWQLLRGRDAYWDNPFEVEARRLSCRS